MVSVKGEEVGVEVRHMVGNWITHGLWRHCKKLIFCSRRDRKLLVSLLLGNTMILFDILKRFLCRLDGGWTHGLHGTGWEIGRTIRVCSGGGHQHQGSCGWLMSTYTYSLCCHSFDLHWWVFFHERRASFWDWGGTESHTDCVKRVEGKGIIEVCLCLKVWYLGFLQGKAAGVFNC